ncbi:hypothetical protein OBBRIDRAFT_871807 [Obba rivulosa]|uniref:Uncharacterized protein n=1 Tax=Obba rivulosa TaxID=1052685 RepID=A0A8E2B179_9APHY|nr:hypothetical protein OBBRIDRAFT_871807 [Obba rivulosa]
MPFFVADDSSGPMVAPGQCKGVSESLLLVESLAMLRPSRHRDTVLSKVKDTPFDEMVSHSRDFLPERILTIEQQQFRHFASASDEESRQTRPEDRRAEQAPPRKRDRARANSGLLRPRTPVVLTRVQDIVGQRAERYAELLANLPFQLVR